MVGPYGAGAVKLLRHCASLVFPVFSFDFSVLTFSRSAPSFSSYLSYRPHGRYLVVVLRDPLTMLVSVTADFTIRRLRVHASSYAVTNSTNRNEKSLTLIIPPHQVGRSGGGFLTHHSPLRGTGPLQVLCHVLRHGRGDSSRPRPSFRACRQVGEACVPSHIRCRNHRVTHNVV